MIPPSRTYIIDISPSDHLVDIHRWSAFEEEGISLWSNQRPLANRKDRGGSSGMSLEMAQQLCNGLLAVLSGHFDRACTEAALRVETQAALREELIAAQQPSPAPQPELDNL